MSFTIHDSDIACPRCQAETLALWVRAERTGAPSHTYTVADVGSQPCVECGYRLTAIEEDAEAEAALEQWEPPTAADWADAKAGV